MIALLSVALADCPMPEAAIDALMEAPSKENYDCVATQQDSGALLIEALESGEEDSRRARALAIWRLLRLDGEIPADEARAYPPSERRLVADAIHARRGRETPSTDHDAVFKNFAWYAPDPAFTKAKLTDVDRTNLEMVNNPPAAPVEPDVDLDVVVPPPLEEESCGCTTGAGASWIAVLLLAAVRRR
jgi:hypothetical protein